MPILELTDEQVVELVTQLPDEQKQRVLTLLAEPPPVRPRARFGSAKNDILYMAKDFDAPLVDETGSPVDCERFLQLLRSWREGDPEQQRLEWEQLEEVLAEERLVEPSS
jgi:hypothetical protein